MDAPLFSIVTVTLNCADDALRTAESVLAQDCDNYEYIVKDGGSTDGTVEGLRRLGVQPLVKPDTGIYDAMNQALPLCAGQYVYFLNGGDTFHDSHVLGRLAAQIEPAAAIVYGDVLRQPWNRRSEHPPELSRCYLFRKNLCHQAWLARLDVYRRLGGFRIVSPVDGLPQPINSDQEFLWKALLEERLYAQRVSFIIADYAHGGYSAQPKLSAYCRRERWLMLKRFYTPAEMLGFGLRSLYFLNPLKQVVCRALRRRQV